MRYINATGDEDFARDVGAELLVETARLWRSLGHHDRHGTFHLDGVTGPDEYTALADDNVYTNLMAARNLASAADVALAYPDVAHRLGVDEEEAASWRDAAAAMRDAVQRRAGRARAVRGLHPLPGVGLRRSTPPEPTRCCCTCRTSTSTASRWSSRPTWCWRCTGAATRSPPSRRPATSPTTRRGPCATRRCRPAPRRCWPPRSGHLELAHDYIAEAALVDLRDRTSNTRDGVHIASLAGAWLGLVAGFGGMRDHDGRLSFAPRLPSRLDRLEFSMLWRGLRLRVTVTADEATYQPARRRTARASS